MNVELQVIGSALRAVAEEMGAVLIRSAFSANIKERRDCSTAIFDEAGRMIAQAEHIPVHLGAMPDAVAAAMPVCQAPGQVCILNDPYTGGTHLPDVTLVSRTELGFAVSRAHHADVGGMEPASLPAFSRELYQEGLIIPPTPLTDEVVERNGHTFHAYGTGKNRVVVEVAAPKTSSTDTSAASTKTSAPTSAQSTGGTQASS